MNAGRLTSFLIPLELVKETDKVTGEITRRWKEHPEIRAERVKYAAKIVQRGGEMVTKVDAVFYIRIQHKVADGWRVRTRDGAIYDVTVEPNRDKQLKLLTCSKVND